MSAPASRPDVAIRPSSPPCTRNLGSIPLPGEHMNPKHVRLVAASFVALGWLGCSDDGEDSANFDATAVDAEADSESQDTAETGDGDNDTVADDATEDDAGQASDTGDNDTDAVPDSSEPDGSDGSDATTVPEPPYPAGMNEVSIAHDELRRMQVYVPETLGDRAPRAIIVVLHGGGGEGTDVANEGEHPLSVFRTVAAREGLVVVYPEGSEARDGRLGWSDCRSDNRQASGLDDIGFLRTVVAQLRADYGLGADQVFMAGTSNGGQMTLAFAANAAEEIGAIAVGNANLPESPLDGLCTSGPSEPVPALFTHGTEDVPMPYEGGCVANLGGGCARGRVIGAEATRDAWLQLNGLSAPPTRTETVEVVADDAGTAEQFVYAGQAPVHWWRLNGAGHVTPSMTVIVEPNSLTGTQNNDVEFAELAWAFFADRLEP